MKLTNHTSPSARSFLKDLPERLQRGEGSRNSVPITKKIDIIFESLELHSQKKEEEEERSP
jgi:hypothetical protein